jgi:septal ring factor EnvC (AmiA/AmiB activator)
MTGAPPLLRTSVVLPIGLPVLFDAPTEDRIIELEAALTEWDARIQELVDAQVKQEQQVVALEESLAQRGTRIGELEAGLNQGESTLKEC